MVLIIAPSLYATTCALSVRAELNAKVTKGSDAYARFALAVVKLLVMAELL